VSRWLGRLAESTQRVQLNYFSAFMEWMGEHGGPFKDMTPDELIECQKNADNGSRYDVLDVVQQYVIEKPGTYNSKNSRYNNVRSFFMHNRAELPRDPGFNINPEREPVRGTLTPDEIRRVVLASNTMYQALFLCMFQGAMDQEMITYWSSNGYDSLAEQLKGDPEAVKINLPGRKSQKFKQGYYTFIGGDAVKSLRTWLKQRQHRVEQGKIPRDSREIFCNQYGETVSKRTIREYWTGKLRRLGIIEPVKRGTRVSRTGKGLHEMRDVFRSLWSKSPASHVVGEYCMGHQIDKLNYDKSWRDVGHYRGEYLKALPWLQLMSRGEAFGRVERDEVERLRRELEEARKGQGDRVTELEDRISRMETQQRQAMAQILRLLEKQKREA